MGAIIETSKLTKIFGDFAAVDKLDFAIPRGASVGLLGPNGAGKSTTINMLLGMSRPNEGAIRVFGEDPTTNGAGVRARVGYVPERHHIYGWMTVGEVLRFVRAFYPTWNDELSIDLAYRYGLSLDKRVRELSNGMGTKLSLVLALSHEPELFIMDEPTTGLDPNARDDFLSIVRETMESRDATVLFSSHIISDVEQIADTIAIMNAGKLLAMCPRDELIRRTKKVDVTLRGSSEKPAAPDSLLREQVDGERWTLSVSDYSDALREKLEGADQVASVAVHDLALDEVFREFVGKPVAE